MPLRVKQLLAFSLFLWVVGLAFLIWVDWRIAVGAFLIIWANNILRK